jgi:hypothetical protein
MLIKAFLSLLQIGFLPGFLVLRCLRLKTQLVQAVIVSFGLSLVINHFLVEGLTVFHLCTSTAFYVIFATEIAALFWLTRSVWTISAADVLKGDLRGLSRFIGWGEKDGPALDRVVLFTLALCCCAWITTIWLRDLGMIFNAWDAIGSWNRWATEWSANHLPSHSRLYPQLLPANLALTYLFTGDKLQFFGHAVMGLFAGIILLTQLDLALRKNHSGYLVAVMLTAYLFPKLFSHTWNDGLADIPLACMGFVSIYCLVIAREKDADAFYWIILGTLCCAGAALTKQGGLYLGLVYPFLASGALRRKANKMRTVALVAILLLLLVAPWYVYKVSQFRAGNDSTETMQMLTSGHEGRNLVQRVRHAWTLVELPLGPPAATLLVLCGTVCCFWSAEWFIYFLFVAVPYVVFWALFLSYDQRNIALAVPIVTTAAGVGAVNCLRRMMKHSLLTHIGDRISRAPLIVYCFLAISVLGILSHSTAIKTLRTLQERELTQLCLPDLNNALYRLFEVETAKGVILTNYQILGYLPGFEQYYRPMGGDNFVGQIANENPRYLLVMNSDHSGDATLIQFIRREVSAGSLKLIFNIAGFTLIERTAARPDTSTATTPGTAR